MRPVLCSSLRPIKPKHRQPIFCHARHSHNTALADNLRSLMRSTAQPVSVLTIQSSGVTLSSFSSISLNPPLISFSLRLPSKCAALLSATPKAAFTLHLLSREQEALATAFAQPGSPDTSDLEKGSLGRMECQVALELDLNKEEKEGSRLYIGRVMEVHLGEMGRPLLWRQKRYCSTDEKE